MSLLGGTYGARECEVSSDVEAFGEFRVFIPVDGIHSETFKAPRADLLSGDSELDHSILIVSTMA
jgi:hypothetical protein